MNTVQRPGFSGRGSAAGLRRRWSIDWQVPGVLPSLAALFLVCSGRPAPAAEKVRLESESCGVEIVDGKMAPPAEFLAEYESVTHMRDCASPEYPFMVSCFGLIDIPADPLVQPDQVDDAVCQHTTLEEKNCGSTGGGVKRPSSKGRTSATLSLSDDYEQVYGGEFTGGAEAGGGVPGLLEVKSMASLKLSAGFSYTEGRTFSGKHMWMFDVKPCTVEEKKVEMYFTRTTGKATGELRLHIYGRTLMLNKKVCPHAGREHAWEYSFGVGTVDAVSVVGSRVVGSHLGVFPCPDPPEECESPPTAPPPTTYPPPPTYPPTTYPPTTYPPTTYPPTTYPPTTYPPTTTPPTTTPPTTYPPTTTPPTTTPPTPTTPTTPTPTTPPPTPPTTTPPPTPPTTTPPPTNPPPTNPPPTTAGDCDCDGDGIPDSEQDPPPVQDADCPCLRDVDTTPLIPQPLDGDLLDLL